jgi:hypothetical protein
MAPPIQNLPCRSPLSCMIVRICFHPYSISHFQMCDNASHIFWRQKITLFTLGSR